MTPIIRRTRLTEPAFTAFPSVALTFYHLALYLFGRFNAMSVLFLHPPTSVDTTIAKILGDSLTTDLTDIELG